MIERLFQTPPWVCELMADKVHWIDVNILEPTPGDGNIVNALEMRGKNVTAPEDFFLMEPRRFDAIVMNPPFSSKYTNLTNAPKDIRLDGMRAGYYILDKCLEMSDNVIALMPLFTIIDSDVRIRRLFNFGIKTVSTLPRKTFDYARIQTCIIEFSKGWTGETLWTPITVQPLTIKRAA